MAPNSDLIAHGSRGIAAPMNRSVYILRENMTRFGWAVEDIVR